MPPRRSTRAKKAPAKKAAASESASASGDEPDLSECVFAISGTLSEPRKAIVARIERCGGTVKSSVTKAVTHLLCANPRANTTKIVKAAASGVVIVGEAFLETGEAAEMSVDEEEEEEASSASASPVAKRKKSPAKKKAPVKKAAPKKKAAVKRKVAEIESGSESSEETAAVVVKGRAAVDALVPGSANWHVYEDGDDVYDVMLNQTNIKNNNNKFYVIQLLEADSGGKYATWNRWGRVGVDGQNKFTVCGSNLDKAKKDFLKKFKDKTKNNWHERADFQTVPGKYTLIEIDYAVDTEEPPAKKARTADLKRTTSSTLTKPVQDLMNLIFDMKMMEKQMASLEFDIKKQPLGRLSKKTLKDGYQVLKDIDDVISGNKKGSLSDLSSRFYTLIPHVFGRKRPPTINDHAMVQKKLEMIQQLVDIEVAATMLKSTGGGSQIDANYEKLNCHIEAIDKKSDEFKNIEKYVKNTYHRGTPPSIINVYALERDGAHDRFSKKGAKVGNRKLLWHGSRLANFVGILSQGLRIAPPEAPVSGYRFGKGLYFADMCGLSALYCRAYGTPDFCMLLADVALGETANLTRDQYMEKPLPKTHSTFATGSEAPLSEHPMELRPSKLSSSAAAKAIEREVTVPLGKPGPTGITSTSVRENQYIVYDVAQAKLQYLLHLRQ